MTPLRRLAWIAAGYAAAAAGAVLYVFARYWFFRLTGVDASGGMFAAGDAMGFVLVAGALGLVPTFFLLRLASEAYPQALAWILLALNATAPLCLWLFSAYASGRGPFSGTANDLLGLAMVFLIGPRVVAIPVMLLVSALAIALARERRTRLLLAGGLLLEAAALVVLVVHFARVFFSRR